MLEGILYPKDKKMNALLANNSVRNSAYYQKGGMLFDYTTLLGLCQP
jgi:hypothetical protein